MNKQLTEDYVSFETAKLLKEKGFDVPVKNYFSLNKDAMLHNLDKKYGAKKNWNAFEICISRPSQSLALKWLREVHDLHIIAYPWQADNEEKAIHWCCTVYKAFAHLGNDVYTNETPKSYEEAIETALLYILKNLI